MKVIKDAIKVGMDINCICELEATCCLCIKKRLKATAEYAYHKRFNKGFNKGFKQGQAYESLDQLKHKIQETKK